jgi:hypothetical protein
MVATLEDPAAAVSTAEGAARWAAVLAERAAVVAVGAGTPPPPHPVRVTAAATAARSALIR